MKFESLASGLFFEAIALCVIASFRFINIESAVTLLFFNLLFILLTFELNGTLNRKLGMLALGNIIGLFWNLSFISSPPRESRILVKRSMFSAQFSVPF